MRLAVPIAAVLLAAAALGACGGESGAGTAPARDGGSAQAGASKAPPGASARDCPPRGSEARALRATAIPCPGARRLMRRWLGRSGCQVPRGTARAGCRIDGYKCLSVRTERGVSVGCARPGRSVAFIARD